MINITIDQNVIYGIFGIFLLASESMGFIKHIESNSITHCIYLIIKELLEKKENKKLTVHLLDEEQQTDPDL
jgi:hypothetical protein